MCAKRINPVTGIIESRDGFIEEIFDVWEPIENGNGNQERIDPETHEYQENDNFFIFDNWVPKE